MANRHQKSGWIYIYNPPRLNGVEFTSEMARALLEICEGDLGKALDFVNSQDEVSCNEPIAPSVPEASETAIRPNPGSDQPCQPGTSKRLAAEDASGVKGALSRTVVRPMVTKP